MTLCIASSNWLTADKFRQGLWEYCIEEDAGEPLPFNLKNGPGCYAGRDVGELAPNCYLVMFVCIYGSILAVARVNLLCIT